MLKTRLAAIDLVQGSLIAAENSTDAACLDTARLHAALLQARQDAGLRLATGLEALSKAAKAAMLATEARRELVEAHALLDKVPAEIGVPAHLYGKDEPSVMRSPAIELAQVD